MKTFLPLTLLLVLFAAGCTGSPELPEVSIERLPAHTDSIPDETESPPTPDSTPTPTPTPAPTPDPTPTPTPYDYSAPVPESEAVDDSWFADAVFIGDSRTDGLQLYSGIHDADFLCHKGMTVFEVMEGKAAVTTEQGNTSVFQALEQKQYAKVYMMLGLNELGYNYDQGFADTYSSIVDKLIELQPDADIYLQSLIPVSTEMCKKTGQSSYVNNEQIAVYNEIIEKIAEEKQVYYVNVKEAMIDETGELPADASSDGIHFHKEGYKTWYEYLKSHTAEEETT